MALSFFRTIRSHLILLVLISILPALAIIIYSGLERSSHEMQDAKDNALRIVKGFAYDHGRTVESTRQFLMTLSKVPEIRNFNVPGSNRLLGELLKQNPLYTSIFVTDSEGVECASALPFTRQSVAHRKYFRDVLKSKALSVGEYVIGITVKQPRIHFAYPILGTGGEFMGAVVVAFEIARYVKMFPLEKLPKGSTLCLIDHRGNLLYHYPAEKQNIPKLEFPDLMGYALGRGEEGASTYTEADGVDFINAHKIFRLRRSEPPYLMIRVDIPKKMALLSARKALSINMALFAAAFIIALASAWFSGNSIIVRRLNKLVNASRMLGQGDLKERTGLVYGHDELGKLAQVFDEMAEALETEHADRKRSERAIYDEKQRFQMLADSAPFGMVLADPTGRFNYINPKFKELFGYDLNDIPDGRTWLRLAFPDRDYRHNAISSWLAESRPVQQHPKVLTVACKDGVRKEITFMTVRLNTGECLTTFEDITEHKRLEAQLLQSQKMEAIGTLAGGIAHDFNNLLMTILGYTSLMLMDTTAQDPNHEKLKIIEKQVQSGADLTRQLLGFARGGKYEVVTTNLNELLAKSSEMFGRTKKEISIHSKYEVDPWPVEVDRGQIEQVLLNLFVNAWQAMPGGGELYLETCNVMLDQIQPRPLSIKPGKYVRVSITDTGIGMDEATRTRIFEPFFTTKEMGRGTGLGLASAYGVIKNHGGAINVYSEKDKGTTFTIYLPASDKKLVIERRISGEALQGTETIMLVDDEEAVLNVGKAILQKLGYTVLPVKSGEEAVRLFAENKGKIDLVILDMVMPGMNGEKVYGELKGIDPQVRVLLSSGYSMNGQAVKIMEQGCNGFIQKPFDVGELSKKIREVLSEA